MPRRHSKHVPVIEGSLDELPMKEQRQILDIAAEIIRMARQP